MIEDQLMCSTDFLHSYALGCNLFWLGKHVKMNMEENDLISAACMLQVWTKRPSCFRTVWVRFDKIWMTDDAITQMSSFFLLKTEEHDNMPGSVWHYYPTLFLSRLSWDAACSDRWGFLATLLNCCCRGNPRDSHSPLIDNSYYANQHKHASLFSGLRVRMQGFTLRQRETTKGCGKSSGFLVTVRTRSGNKSLKQALWKW